MARLSIVAFLALAFSSVASAAPQNLGAFGDIRARDNQEYTNCGDPGAVLSLDVSPRPAVAGEDLTVKVNADTRFPLEGVVYVEVNVLHGTEVIESKAVDVCKGPCNIAAGHYEFDYTVTLPTDFHPSDLKIVTGGTYPSICFEFTPVA